MNHFFQDKTNLLVSISINSLFAFLSSILLFKGIVAFAKYVTIIHFSGIPKRVNYEIACVSHPFSSIWTYNSVISIYSIGIVTAAFFIFVSYMLQSWCKKNGVRKLFFIWMFIHSLHHSFGMLVKGIILKQDVYFALAWMHIPFGLMVVLGVFFLFIYSYILYQSFYMFIKVSPSQSLIATLENKVRFFILHYFVIVCVGYFILFLINAFSIHMFEIIEFSLLIVPLSFAMLRNSNKNVRLIKNSNLSVINPFLLLLTLVLLVLYIYVAYV